MSSSAAQRLPDPFNGIYTPFVCAWWSDPGSRTALDEQVSHFRALIWSMYSSAGGTELQRLRSCFLLVAGDDGTGRHGERTSLGQLCACEHISDVELAQTSPQGYSAPSQGLAALVIDLETAADQLGLRWPITRQVFSAQERSPVLERRLDLLNADHWPYREVDRTPYPGGWFAFKLMASYLGYRWTCRWPRETIAPLTSAPAQAHNPVSSFSMP